MHLNFEQLFSDFKKMEEIFVVTFKMTSNSFIFIVFNNLNFDLSVVFKLSQILWIYSVHFSYEFSLVNNFIVSINDKLNEKNNRVNHCNHQKIHMFEVCFLLIKAESRNDDFDTWFSFLKIFFWCILSVCHLILLFIVNFLITFMHFK